MLLSHTPELRMAANRDAKDGLSHAERRQNGRRFAAFCNAARNALILNGLRTGKMTAFILRREDRRHALRRPSSCVKKAVLAVRLDGLSVPEWRTALIGSADCRFAKGAAADCKPHRDKELQTCRNNEAALWIPHFCGTESRRLGNDDYPQTCMKETACRHRRTKNTSSWAQCGSWIPLFSGMTLMPRASFNSVSPV